MLRLGDAGMSQFKGSRLFLSQYGCGRLAAVAVIALAGGSPASGLQKPSEPIQVFDPTDRPAVVGQPKLLNVTQVFDNLNFPAEVREARAKGMVRVRLRINSAGEIESCTVVVQSTSAAMNSEACRIYTQHARFAPARDATGKAMPASAEFPVAWDFRGGGGKPRTPWQESWVSVIADDGVVRSCTLISNGGEQLRCSTGRLFPPDRAADIARKLGSSIFEFREDKAFVPGETAQRVTTPTGMVLLARGVVLVAIDSNGAVTSCELLPDSMPTAMPACEKARQSLFVGATESGELKGTMTISVYIGRAASPSN